MNMKTTVLAESKEEHECRCHEFLKVSPGASCPMIKKITHPLRYYQFTEDEMKALEECDHESFYQRCLPLSTIFATFTYAAMRYGLMKKSVHFGPWPKLLVAVLLGHWVGRMSYIPEYDRKLRSLTADSKLGAVMRNHFQERNSPPETNK